MWKKLISIMLVMIMLMNNCPLDVFAGQKTEDVLSKIDYIDELSGMKENAAKWHAGMGITDKMHAGQVEEALDAILTDRLKPMETRLEKLDVYAWKASNKKTKTKSFLKDKDIQQLKDALADLHALEDEIQTCYEIVSSNRYAIYEEAKSIEDKKVTGEESRESLSYHILDKVEELENYIKRAADHYDSWMKTIDHYEMILDMAFSSKKKATYKKSDKDLKTSIVNLKSSYMKEMNRLSKDLTKEEKVNDADADILVITRDQFAVCVRDEGKKGIQDVSVTCWGIKSFGDKQEIKDKITLKTDKDGIAVFSCDSLAMDANDTMYIGMEIKKNGYQKIYAEPSFYSGGDVAYVSPMKRSSEKIYIAGASLNGRDMLVDQKTLYITKANDAEQDISVFLDTSDGRKPAGNMSMHYVDQDEKEQVLTLNLSDAQKISEGYYKLSFKGIWCQIFKEDQASAVSFTFSNVNGSESEATQPFKLITSHAKVYQPTTVNNVDILNSFLLKGFDFPIPTDVPILSKLTLNIALQPPKLYGYYDQNGKWLFIVGSDEVKIPGIDTKDWKTRDQKEVDSLAERTARETGQNLAAAQKDVLAGKRNDGENLFLGNIKSYFAVTGVAYGETVNDEYPIHPEYQLSEDLTNKGKLDVSLVAGVKGDFSKEIIVPSPFSVPLEFALGFSLDVCGGVLSGVNFTYRGSPLPPVGNTAVPAFDDLTFQKGVNLDLIIAGQLALSVGVGIPALMEVGVKGISTLSVDVPMISNDIPTQNISDTKMALTLTAMTYVRFMFLTAKLPFAKFTTNMEHGDFTTQGDVGFKEKKKSSNEEKERAKNPLIASGENADAIENVQDDAIDSDFSGDIPWYFGDQTYAQYFRDKPAYMTLRSNMGSGDFAIWKEDDKTVKYCQVSSEFASEISLPMPDEVDRHLNASSLSEKWKIVSVGAEASPQIYHLEGFPTQDVQVGIITVSIGKDLARETYTFEDGSKKEIYQPQSSMIVAYLVVYDGSGIDIIERWDGTGNPIEESKDAIFCFDLGENVYSEMMPLLTKLNLSTYTYPPQVPLSQIYICCPNDNLNLEPEEASNAEEMTTEACTAEEMTTEASMAEEATTEAGMAEEATTEASMAEEVTAEASMTEEVTAEVGTAEEVITEASTAEEATATEASTAEEVTTEASTAEEVTTEANTVEEVTNEPYMTQEDPSNADTVIVLYAVPKDTTDHSFSQIYMRSDGGTTEYKLDGIPMKMMSSGAGIVHNGFARCDNGDFWALFASREKQDLCEDFDFLKKVKDYTVLQGDSEDKVSVFCLVEDEDEAGNSCNKLMLAEMILDDDYVYDVKMTDFGVKTNANYIFSGNVTGDDVIYWFEEKAYAKEEAQNQRMYQLKEEDLESKLQVRAMVYDAEKNRASHPFTMGVLQDASLSDYDSMPVPLDSMVSDGKIYVTFQDNATKSEGEEFGFKTYQLDAKRVAKLDIMGMEAEEPIYCAGKHGTMEITVANRGNVSIVGYDMTLSYKSSKEGQEEEWKDLQQIHFDLLNPDNNKITYYDGQEGSGKDVARRIDGILDGDNGDEWFVKEEGKETEHIITDTLMPEGVHTDQFRFNLPNDWEYGTKTLRIRVDSVYTPSRFCGFLPGYENTPVLQIRAPKAESNVMINKPQISLAGTMKSFTKSGKKMRVARGKQGEVTLKNGNKINESWADVGFVPVDFEIRPNISELTLDYQTFDKNGKTFVTISARRDGDIANLAARGITVRAWVDGKEDDPTYTHTYSNNGIADDFVYSITLPAETLTGGQTAKCVTVEVADNTEDSRELTEFNNRHTFDLHQTLLIVEQPKDVVVKKGKSASFTVKVENGKEPYKYQWQQYSNGKKGSWQDIKDAKSETFVLDKVNRGQDNMLYRCVITDAMGNKLVSDMAKLIVKK